MKCNHCGEMALGGMSLCRACLRKRCRDSSKRCNPAVSAGFAHYGTHITPVPPETLAKVRRWQQQEAREEAETQAEKIAAMQERVKNFFEEAAEELAQEVNRPKYGIQAIPTCECGRKLIDGECYKCRR